VGDETEPSSPQVQELSRVLIGQRSPVAGSWATMMTSRDCIARCSFNKISMCREDARAILAENTMPKAQPSLNRPPAHGGVSPMMPRLIDNCVRRAGVQAGERAMFMVVCPRGSKRWLSAFYRADRVVRAESAATIGIERARAILCAIGGTGNGLSDPRHRVHPFQKDGKYGRIIVIRGNDSGQIDRGH